MERQSKVLVKRNFSRVKKRVFAHLLSKKTKDGGFPGMKMLRKLIKKGKGEDGGDSKEEGKEGEEEK